MGQNSTEWAKTDGLTFKRDEVDKDGGATVAKAKHAYIIGLYNTTNKYKYDRKELPQYVSKCNTAVEELANQLKG